VVDDLPLTAIGKIYKPALRADAVARAAREALRAVLGGPGSSVAAEPGGTRGMRVVVTLAAEDADRRSAVEAALAPYLFETVVAAAPPR
jgi:fatty-acyl-CoA synthase